MLIPHSEIMLGRCMFRDSYDHEYDKRFVYEPSVVAGGVRERRERGEGAVEVHKQSFIKRHAHRNHSTYSLVACAGRCCVPGKQGISYLHFHHFFPGVRW